MIKDIKKESRIATNHGRSGYKHTPLGWITEEWEVLTIEELLDKKILIGHLDGNHGALYPRAEEFVSTGIPYISANNFISGLVDFKGCKYLSPDRAKQFKKGVAKDGDVLFAHNATVGPVAILETKLEYVILSTTATYFRCNLSLLSNQYLKEFFTSAYFVNQYSRVMGQSTRNQVPITTQRDFFIILPSLNEQQRIASILSCWDSAINKTHQLIEQLKRRNKGLMQELLKGKKGWHEKSLSDIFQRVVDKNTIANTNVVTISAQRGFVKQDDFFKKLVASDILDNYFLVKKGDFCYNKSYSNGYDWGAIKRLNDFDQAVVTTLYICFRLRNTTEYSCDYFEYFFDANLLDKGLAKIAHEGGRAHGLLNVTSTDFFGLKIQVPPYQTQIEIYNILSTANDELKIAIEKLNLLVSQKKGLMQLLLTGEIRVKS